MADNTDVQNASNQFATALASGGFPFQTPPVQFIEQDGLLRAKPDISDAALAFLKESPPLGIQDKDESAEEFLAAYAGELFAALSEPQQNNVDMDKVFSTLGVSGGSMSSGAPTKQSLESSSSGGDSLRQTGQDGFGEPTVVGEMPEGQVARNVILPYDYGYRLTLKHVGERFGEVQCADSFPIMVWRTIEEDEFEDLSEAQAVTAREAGQGMTATWVAGPHDALGRLMEPNQQGMGGKGAQRKGWLLGMKACMEGTEEDGELKGNSWKGEYPDFEKRNAYSADEIVIYEVEREPFTEEDWPTVKRVLQVDYDPLQLYGNSKSTPTGLIIDAKDQKTIKDYAEEMGLGKDNFGNMSGGGQSAQKPQQPAQRESPQSMGNESSGGERSQQESSEQAESGPQGATSPTGVSVPGAQPTTETAEQPTQERQQERTREPETHTVQQPTQERAQQRTREPETHEATETTSQPTEQPDIENIQRPTLSGQKLDEAQFVEDFEKRMNENFDEALDVEGAAREAMEAAMVTDDEVEYAKQNYDTSNWNDFFADCRGEGYDAGQCGDMWQELKKQGVAKTKADQEAEEKDEPEPEPEPEPEDENDTEGQDAAGGVEATAVDLDAGGVSEEANQPDMVYGTNDTSALGDVEDLDEVVQPHGQAVLVTMESCPGCRLLKDREVIQEGLKDGRIIEVGQQDPMWEPLLLHLGTDVTPTWAFYHHEKGFIDEDEAKEEGMA